MKTKHFKILGCAALSIMCAMVSHAQSVSSTPVGYMTQTISAGTGTGRVFTPISLPLYEPASVTSASGSITSVTATGITVDSAGFGDLSASTAPYAVRITSGAAEGANLLISSNTSDSITFDIALSSVSSTSDISAGDTYEIIAVDTLSSLFGGPNDGVIFGAASQSDADVVFVYSSGSWLAHFHNGSNWVRKSGRSTIISNDLPLTPDRPVLFSRISDVSTSYVLTGTVPSTDSVLKLNASGFSFLANNTPAAITLGNLQLQNSSGFVNGLSGDAIYLYSSGSWLKYNHDGTNWIRKSGRSTLISNDVEIPSGSAFLFSRASAGSASSGTLELQYSL